MGPVGFEHPPQAQPKTAIPTGDGAKSDAQRAPKPVEDLDLAQNLSRLVQEYPGLGAVVKAWPELPKNIKAAIKALIQTNNKEVK